MKTILQFIPSYSTFLLLSVVVCIIGKSESIDFCKTFRDNGNRIDYSFEPYYYTTKDDKSQISSDLLFIIDNNYWNIIKLNGGFEFQNKESSNSSLFGYQYTAVFSAVFDQTFIYGFVFKNNSIDWRLIDFEGEGKGLNWNSAKLNRSQIDTNSVIEFNNYTHYILILLSIDSTSTFILNIGYNSLLGTEEQLFELNGVRYEFVFNSSTEQLTPNIASVVDLNGRLIVKNVSKRLLIIAVKQISERLDRFGLEKFYVSGNSVEYCSDSQSKIGADISQHIIDCKRRTLIDCSISVDVITGDNNSVVWIFVFIIIVCLIVSAIALIIWLIPIKQNKKRKPKNVDKSELSTDSLSELIT